MNTKAWRKRPVRVGQPSLFDTHSPTILLINLNVCGCATMRKTRADRNEIKGLFSAIFTVYTTKKIHLKGGVHSNVY